MADHWLQEEIRDLLLADASAGQSVHIREVPGGGICLAGATEKEVGSKAQMAEMLSRGTLQRATASTNMNKHSSRSHAIFTITVEQRRQLTASSGKADVNEEVPSLLSVASYPLRPFVCVETSEGSVYTLTVVLFP